MIPRNDAVVYIECKFGLIMSQLAKRKIRETIILKTLTSKVFINIPIPTLIQYIKKHHIRIVVIIASKNIKLKLNNINLIFINLQNFISYPEKY